MKYILSLILILSSNLFSQQTNVTVQDLLSLNQVVTSQTSLGFSIIASQGDATSCKVVKINSSTITLIVSCLGGDGKSMFGTEIIRASGTNVQSTVIAFGDVLCMLAMNPNATPVLMGSFGNVPANGVGYSCSTNIRVSVGGGISGQTAPTVGNIVWP